jgi:hypothetical protein
VTSPIYTGGDDDAGGRDPVAGSVAGAVAAADARYLQLQSDTYGQGSHIGDLMDLPVVPANAVPPSQSDLYPYAGMEPTPAGAGFEHDEPMPG